MKYEYTVKRELFVTVEVEADDEEQAQEVFEKEWVDTGNLTDLFREELLEAYDEVQSVAVDGYTIYRI